MRGHEDPRLRSADAGLPRPLAADDLPAFELLRRLAEVPDGAALVLRVPVERVLGESAAVEPDAVVNDRRVDAQDRLRRARDGEELAPGDAVLLAAVAQRRARRQGEPWVVHSPGEIARRGRQRGAACERGEKPADQRRTSQASWSATICWTCFGSFFAATSASVVSSSTLRSAARTATQTSRSCSAEPS